MNELLFVGLFFTLASLSLGAFRLGKSYQYALIAALAILMNIFVLKPFEIFGLTTYGGNVLYGCIFLTTDLLAEHYGKKAALRGVGVGFLALALYLIVSQFYLAIAPATALSGATEIQAALATIFTPAWGIVVASLSAFLLSNTLDVHVYDRIHRLTGKKLLWLRNNASTWLSQLVDTIVFSSIAAAFGIFAWEVVPEVILFAYIFKLAVAAFDTPFLYLSQLFKKNA